MCLNKILIIGKFTFYNGSNKWNYKKNERESLSLPDKETD